MKHVYCQCKDCRKAKRNGKVLGGYLLKYLGEHAYFVSGYINHHRFVPGKRPVSKFNAPLAQR